jgi:hypothetical protein
MDHPQPARQRPEKDAPGRMRASVAFEPRMNLLARIYFFVAGALFSLLVILRIARPDLVVSTGLGFGLNGASGFALFLGLAEWKHLPVGGGLDGKVGGGLVLLSTMVFTVVVDEVVDLAYLSRSLNTEFAILFAMLGLATAVAWWNVLFRTAQTLSRRNEARPVLWAAFIIAMVVIMLA